MRAVDIIARKRNGVELTDIEIEELVLGFAAGDIPDYQMAAWLMAVFLKGLGRRETRALTRAMVRSGRELSWTRRLPFVADKHSTGGVGDKTSLVVVPLVAAAGVPVAKMSGRGLGFTGGTLDKLESIPGFQVRLSTEQFQRQVEKIGLAIVAQTADLAPGDGKIYALRDATATVESLPLIASSVMAKKIAAGAHGIVLDVKVGRGAFAKTPAEALALAEVMLDLGRVAGRRVSVVISRMDAPLGCAVGNALEVVEAVQTLRGEGPDDLSELSLSLGAQMLTMAEVASDEGDARRRLREVLASGSAVAKLEQMVEAQGGDPRALSESGALPRATVVNTVHSPRSGYVSEIDAQAVGEAVVRLGGGRARKEDAVDHAVGIVLRVHPGTLVAAGDPLFGVHASVNQAAELAAKQVLAAFGWSEEPPHEKPLVLRVLT